MTQIIFTACLLASPTDCEEHRLFAGIDEPALQCVLTAQQRLAEWASAHPKFRVERWRCSSEREVRA